MALIAPSILSADFLNLGKEISDVTEAGAHHIHIDVMDGHFVNNLTLGPPIIEAIKKQSALPLDVHLMIENPERMIDDYVRSGADFLTVHAEACVHLDRVIKHIKSHRIKAGVALNPSTHENTLEYCLDEIDLVLVMTVNPGFGGQDFLMSAIKKIAAIKNMLIEAGNSRCIISVDGGITDQSGLLARKAGATCLVAGSYIFKSGDYRGSIDKLKKVFRSSYSESR